MYTKTTKKSNNNWEVTKTENKQSFLAFTENKLTEKTKHLGNILQKNKNKQIKSYLKKTIITKKKGGGGLVWGDGGLV